MRVFTKMKQFGAFIAFGTIDYAEPTGNPAACNEELEYNHEKWSLEKADSRPHDTRGLGF